MSFGTLVDALRSALPGLSGFGSKTEIPNAYDLGGNGQQFLRDGWGLTFGAARQDFPLTEYGGSLADNHTFSVQLAREVLATSSNPDPLIEAIKSMKADVLTLQRALLAPDPPLGLPAEVEIIRYTSTSAVTMGSRSADDYRWITCAVTFNATLRETLT